jgi:hypothetical protein
MAQHTGSLAPAESAEREGVNRSEIIRQILARHLKRSK